MQSMNEANDEQVISFEKYLRGFHPVKPTASLPAAPRSMRLRALAFSAAALLLFGLLMVMIPLRSSRMKISGRAEKVVGSRGPVKATVGQLNVALRLSDQDLGRMLDQSSSTLLPRAHPGTALYELSKQ
jgi:hypothetical protein